MKKVLYSIITILLFIAAPNIVKAEDKVTIYLFRSMSCTHCEAALEYINEHKEEIPENINFITYEISKNSNNSSLMDKVSDKLDIPEENRDSIPLFVIGDKYKIGYSSAADFNNVLNIAKEYTTSEDYKDIVKETLQKTQINAKSLKLEQIFSEPNKVVTIVVYCIFGAIVLGLGAMILFSRKN